MGIARAFRKYGEHFEKEDPDRVEPSAEPESPYEALPYVEPKKRSISPVAKEQIELAELRPGTKSHWD